MKFGDVGTRNNAVCLIYYYAPPPNIYLRPDVRTHAVSAVSRVSERDTRVPDFFDGVGIVEAPGYQLFCWIDAVGCIEMRRILPSTVLKIVVRCPSTRVHSLYTTQASDWNSSQETLIFSRSREWDRYTSSTGVRGSWSENWKKKIYRPRPRDGSQSSMSARSINYQAESFNRFYRD